MAESTLAIGRTELRIALADLLGMDPALTDAGDLAKLDAYISQGIRAVYWNKAGHRWSFLSPTRTLVTSAPYSTGTVAVTNGSATVTGTLTVFPSWAASGSIRINGSRLYTILTRGGDTSLTLDEVWAGTTGTGLTYILSQEVYDLPDDFGALAGDITYEPGLSGQKLLIINEGRLRDARQGGNYTGGKPLFAAIRPKLKGTSTTVGQRQEIMFLPDPDASYTLSYPYDVFPNALGSADYFTYGGAALSELILQSCLAVAENRALDNRGIHQARFDEMLSAAIAVDLRQRPRNFGYNGDRSDDLHSRKRPILSDTNESCTYNGVQV